MDVAGLPVVQLGKVKGALAEVNRSHAIPRSIVPMLETRCTLETRERLVKQREGCALVPEERVSVHVTRVELQRTL